MALDLDLGRDVRCFLLKCKVRARDALHWLKVSYVFTW